MRNALADRTHVTHLNAIKKGGHSVVRFMNAQQMYFPIPCVFSTFIYIFFRFSPSHNVRKCVLWVEWVILTWVEYLYKTVKCLKYFMTFLVRAALVLCQCVCVCVCVWTRDIKYETEGRIYSRKTAWNSIKNQQCMENWTTHGDEGRMQ